ncbi:hypothetical protein ON010_g8886 [Phytophthora cinnamomi]|nr:hypothetical protein ON010_g8886 [Phytophthora cinnamomi]
MDINFRCPACQYLFLVDLFGSDDEDTVGNDRNDTAFDTVEDVKPIDDDGTKKDDNTIDDDGTLEVEGAIEDD